MNITRHIEFDLELKMSDDLTDTATDLTDFVGDTPYLYKEIVSSALLEKKLEDFLANIDIKIKKIWYEVENKKDN